MKAIYWNHTPLDKSGHRPTCIDVTLVVNIEGRTYRVTLHWDTFYSFQTHGEVAVRDGNEFNRVLYLHHHDMTGFAGFDRMEPPQRGEMERAGHVERLLREQAEALAILGSRMMKGASQ